MKLTKTTKTYYDNKKDKKWEVIDADGKTLGRLATTISNKLRGKDSSQFSSNSDMGHYVVVINAEKVKLTGNKLLQKKYYKHTGYFSGIKEISAEKLMEKNPEEIILHSVKGMLPKSKLSKQVLNKLKVYKGDKHPHNAQNKVEESK
jgi:large subunit ribosomal protein L13